MSRKRKLPPDIRLECLAVVRGYDRRVKAYHNTYRQIVDGGSNNDSRMPSGTECSRTVESKAMRLGDIEHWPETQRMRAVERAKIRIGTDMDNETVRQKLINGIMLNCESGRKYPFCYLGIDGISKSDFQRRRDRFLYDIAEQLEMV